MLAEGTNEFAGIEQSRMLAERHFDLRRIRANRFDVFSTISDLENASITGRPPGSAGEAVKV
jgi:hypothetical protein